MMRVDCVNATRGYYFIHPTKMMKKNNLWVGPFKSLIDLGVAIEKEFGVVVEFYMPEGESGFCAYPSGDTTMPEDDWTSLEREMEAIVLEAQTKIAMKKKAQRDKKEDWRASLVDGVLNKIKGE